MSQIQVERELESMGLAECRSLFEDCDRFWKTGVAAEDSPLRLFTAKYQEATTMSMTFFAAIVFRQGAKEWYEETDPCQHDRLD